MLAQREEVLDAKKKKVKKAKSAGVAAPVDVAEVQRLMKMAKKLQRYLTEDRFDRGSGERKLARKSLEKLQSDIADKIGALANAKNINVNTKSSSSSVLNMRGSVDSALEAAKAKARGNV